MKDKKRYTKLDINPVLKTKVNESISEFLTAEKIPFKSRYHTSDVEDIKHYKTHDNKCISFTVISCNSFTSALTFSISSRTKLEVSRME